MSARPVAFAALLLAALHVAPAAAQTASFAPKVDVKTQLLIGEVTKSDAATRWAGLDVQLGAGWHTYWRSPGDAGAPPEFDWSGSRNVADVTVAWPAPRRFSEQDIDTFGYQERVLFPLKVRLRDGSAPAHLALKAELYVCSIICTQQQANLEADITPGSGQPDHQALIDEWLRKVPQETAPSLSISALRLERQPKPHLVLDAQAQPPLDAPDVFVDGDAAIGGGRPQILSRSGADALISVPVQGLDQADPQHPLHVTLIDGDRSLEAILPGAALKPSPAGNRAPAAPALDSRPASISAIFGLALLGGFILNFMPCVFPVLSLKLVSLMDHREAGASPPRSAFLATAAGILASFAALAATLSILKVAGAEVGWGLQFQQPAFLITMTVVLVAFGANLLGLFEITLPWWIAGRLGTAGPGRTIAAHMFNGFVMTLLATPCSAPFVGTAIAFALSQRAPQIFLVFAGLGLGMALPYLSLAAVPRLAGLFPRPGRWMLTLRAVAAAAMIATALWLLTVLAEISGPAVAVVVGGVLLAPLLILGTLRFRLLHAMLGAGAAISIGLAVIAATRMPSPDAESRSRQIAWQPLVPAGIAAQVRAGHTVFVDIGAAWCVTCKVNETLVIDSAAVRDRLTSDVIPVKADWTKPDDAISAYLKSFDRYGLPFNVVFGPGAPTGLLLPELLTPQIVLDAINTASASSHETKDRT